MIQGIVNDRHEAIVRLRVRGPGGVESEVSAIVDSGFTSSLTLPMEMIAGCHWRSLWTASVFGDQRVPKAPSVSSPGGPGCRFGRPGRRSPKRFLRSRCSTTNFLCQGTPVGSPASQPVPPRGSLLRTQPACPIPTGSVPGSALTNAANAGCRQSI